MDGRDVSAEFPDWELLPNSDTDPVINSPRALNNNNSRNIDEIEADSEGVLRLDYFSLENDNRYAKTGIDVSSVEGSVDSDNPSWIDPGPEPRYQRRNSGEFWPDSGSDRSDERKLSDSDVKTELGFVDNVKPEVVFQGVGEIEGKSQSTETTVGNLEGKFDERMEKLVGIEELEEKHSKDKFWSDSGVDSLVSGDVDKMREVSENLDELNTGDAAKQDNSSVVAVGDNKPGGGGGGDEEKRKVVWWKVPFELLRYCVFRISPVWTFSMAAAFMGFVILGRRLYKMKHKTRGLPLKVTVDDKKVSQFTSRAARLNEAFSVVRRVPIVRPLLPASGVNSWPVMTLR